MAEDYKKAAADVLQTRDDSRPEMKDVVRVLDRLFEQFSLTGDFRTVDRGPEIWTWMDGTHADRGYVRWFVLGRSAMEGAVGYPMITIRHCTAPRLDAWLTFSQLIMGPNDRDIETSFAMAAANHHGAYEGFRDTIAQVVEMTTARESLGRSQHDPKKDVN